MACNLMVLRDSYICAEIGGSCRTLPEIGLPPDTVLQLAPNFRTRLDAADHVILDSPVGTVVGIGPQGFAILSMFSRPLTLGDALERVEAEAEFGGSTTSRRR